MRLGVRGKVVVSAGAIVLGLLLVSSYINMLNTRRLLFEGVTARAESLSGRLSGPLEGFIKTGVSLEMLDPFSSDARQMVEASQGLLESVAFVDKSGTIRVHSDARRTGSPEPNAAVRAALATLDRTAVNVDGARELIVLVPVRDGTGTLAGGIKLAFSQRLIAAERNRALLQQGILLVVFIGVTVFALSTLMTRTVSGPLTVVGAAANAIAEGRLGERVPIRGDDEIAALGRRFNEMADQLGAIINPVQSASRQVALASTQVAGSQGTVREGAESQHRSLERTTVALGELGRAAVTIQDRVEAVSEAAQSASSTSLELSAAAAEVTAHVDTLAQSVETTSAGITQIAASLRQAETTIEQLARATDTVASSLTQMDASISQIDKIAEDAAGVSGRLAKDAEGGRDAVASTVEGMERIRISSQAAAAVLRSFDSTAAEIGKILRMIDEVADQTNLLALNAAIIAAQAGEQGRGFAVVAGEIKALAERTAVSTREIAALVDKVQSGSRAAVAAMEEGETAIADGVARSRRAGEALAEILAGVRDSQEMVARIARATQEHANGSRLVTQSVTQISAMTRELRAGAAEQAKSGAEVARAAAAMTETSRVVRRSAHEQRDGSKAIGQVMEGVAESVKRIAQATQQQKDETREIVATMDAVRRIAETTLSTAADMNGVVDALTREAATLETSLGRFAASS